eukprot:TRINITY_DN608_c0_g3_i1.p1 TRINITY_DN608_c0_g3~~TRINITY_DN608_c0_g3_i1.p1  ORF type:complete len:1093 (+),score=489.05 TRINITY_DN608_c0_g3_i1:51-3281(+)
MSALGEQDKKIRVAVRARPLHPERERYDVKCVRKVDEKNIVVSRAEAKDARAETIPFGFDHAFDEDDQQIEVYNEAVLEMVDSTLDGHNACVLAYGQTGAGKTFTMLGEVDEQGDSLLKPNSGLFLRVLTDLFLYKERCQGHMHVTIALSIIEIYVQEIRDLLNNKKPLKTQTTKDDVILPELTIVSVESLKDVYKFFKIADKQRVAKKTAMNDVSSRSHALFMVDLFQQARSDKNPEPPQWDKLKAMVCGDAGSPKNKKMAADEIPITRSRIVLVDLAGSERIGRSKVEGQMKTEAVAINMSLTVLGTVVTNMYKGSKHIPYRDSPLTMALKSVFTDPNCRVLLCANMSPAVSSYSETKSTLQFANKVKEIKAASVSVDPQAEQEYLEQLKKLEELCGDLRIASVLHEFILQDPKRISYVPLKDEKRRDELVKQISEGYKAEISKRKEIKEQQEEREIHKLAQKLQEGVIKENQEKEKKLQDQIEELGEEIKSMEAKIVDLEKQKQGELEQKTNEAKKVRRKRRDAEDKLAKLNTDNGGLVKELEDLEKQLSAQSANTPGGPGGADEAKKDEEEAARAEAQIAESQKIYDQIMHIRNHQVDYLRARVRGQQLQKEARKLDKEEKKSAVTWKEGYPMCSGMVHWLVDRATRISEKTASHDDGETCEHLTRLLPAECWRNPLVLKHTYHQPLDHEDIVDGPLETDYESEPDSPPLVKEEDAFSTPTPSAPPVLDATWANESATPGAAAPILYDFVSSAKKKEAEEKKREEEDAKMRQRMQQQQQARAVRKAQTSDVTKPYDEEEADKQYLMSIYDRANLVPDLLYYLHSGTMLVKHGRNGKPHKRRFQLEGKTELTWTDETQPLAGGAKGKRSIKLSEITAIILGMYSKVFKREKVGPATDGFYRSFTLVVKGGKRTVDVVAENVSEFEAWLIGLSNLLHIEPVWGEQLDFAQLNDPAETAAARTMKSSVLDLLRRHHIRPTQCAKVRTVVMEKRDEVLANRKLFNGDMDKVFKAIGGIHPPCLNSFHALLVTKGELRYYTQIDIFRTCIMWKIFENEGVIYDPRFKFPCGPFSEKR